VDTGSILPSVIRILGNGECSQSERDHVLKKGDSLLTPSSKNVQAGHTHGHDADEMVQIDHGFMGLVAKLAMRDDENNALGSCRIVLGNYLEHVKHAFTASFL
jgi:hypothetical protein